MYRVAKQFTFDAAHKLIAPYEGKCTRLHGHRWKVQVVVHGEMLDNCGMLMDFADYGRLDRYLGAKFDHCTLNEIVKQPTAENIAKHIYDWCRAYWNVESVRVWESETTWGEISR